MKRLTLIIGMWLGMAFSLSAAETPEYPGGTDALENYLAENMKYPATARNNGIEGVVNISFVVNIDGSIGQIKVVRMVDPDLEQEAIRLVKSMPAWTPAEKNGQPVPGEAVVAVNFSLE